MTSCVISEPEGLFILGLSISMSLGYFQAGLSNLFHLQMPELKLVDYGFSASDSESEEDTPFTPGDLKLQAIWKRVRPSQTDQHDIDDILATLNSIVQAVIEFHETKKPLAISFVHDRRGFRDPISDSSDDDDCQTDATSEVVEVSAGESDSDAEEMPQ